MASLVFTEGPQQGRHYVLGQSNLVMVGRDATCSIQILDSRLSRHHMQIKLDADSGRHEAIDFDSRNGILVNGTKVDKSAMLSDGDVIELGSSRAVYSQEDHPSAESVRDISKRFGQGHVHTQFD